VVGSESWRVEEQAFPYHVMAISELAKNYSAAAFRIEIGHCLETIDKILDGFGEYCNKHMPVQTVPIEQPPIK
jgi:hypothetical protein